VYIWEPLLLLGNKPLSREERELLLTTTPGTSGVQELYRRTYDLIQAANIPNVFDIENVFSSTGDNIYLDQAHVSPEGNSIIAARIFDIMKSK
jgi:hypothetical protein